MKSIMFIDNETGKRRLGNLIGRLVATSLCRVDLCDGSAPKLVQTTRIRALAPEIGKEYDIPSGLGGTFTARLLSCTETDGTFRIISTAYPDWHDYVVTVALDDVRPLLNKIPVIT